jgi:dienelactone hydrolase
MCIRYGVGENATSMDSLREQIASFLGFSLPSVASTARVLSSIEDHGFQRKLVQYSSRDGEEIQAFLFVPNGPVRGAALALHQHNSQWEIGKSEVAGLVGDPLQAFGPALARQGITVLAPDSVGFESRMKAVNGGIALAPQLERAYGTAEGWLQYYNQMAYRLVVGDLLIRKVLEDCADGLSVLQVCSGSPRLGVIGHSFGGIAALFLAALDTRVAFACTSGAVGSMRKKLASGTGLEMSLVIPGFLQRFDMDDMLRCVAPRSIFVVSSESDPQTADADEVVANARSSFRDRHCERHLLHLRVPGPHPLDRQRMDAMVEWMVAEALSS